MIIGSNNLELLYNEALQATGDEFKRPGSLESLVLYAIQLVWLRKTVNQSLHSSTFFVRYVQHISKSIKGKKFISEDQNFVQKGFQTIEMIIIWEN